MGAPQRAFAHDCRLSLTQNDQPDAASSIIARGR